jgi:hypothetical protein
MINEMSRISRARANISSRHVLTGELRISVIILGRRRLWRTRKEKGSRARSRGIPSLLRADRITWRFIVLSFPHLLEAFPFHSPIILRPWLPFCVLTSESPPIHLHFSLEIQRLPSTAQHFSADHSSRPAGQQRSCSVQETS